MVNVTGLPVLDVVIGLAFLYFLLSIVCSSISEIVASIVKLRAATLETGLRVLLGSKTAADAFFANWRIDLLHTPKWTSTDKRQKSRKPSYIAPRTAALAIVDTFVPAAAERAKKIAPDSTPSADELAAIQNLVSGIEDAKTKTWLTSLVVGTRGDLDAIRKDLETRFDEVMDRATGWYK